MASSKTEKDKTDDELSASISKSMTIDKLKEDLKNANISISGLKKKADYVNLYISNGLHNGASVTAAVASSKAPSVKEDEIKLKEGQPKEELIMSLMISAHGEESYEWPPYMPVAQYYRNNVRVYSRACVPGVTSLRNHRHVRQSIDDTFTIFQNNPGKATQEVMAEYTGVDRDHYRKFLDSFTQCDITRPALMLKNKERCGGLSTYLSQKQFVFTEPISSKAYYNSEHDWNQFLASRGINVSDIRLKVTTSDGSVHTKISLIRTKIWDIIIVILIMVILMMTHLI